MRLCLFFILSLIPTSTLAADLPLRVASLNAAIHFIASYTHADASAHTSVEQMQSAACSLRRGLNSAETQWRTYAANTLALRMHLDPAKVRVYLSAKATCTPVLPERLSVQRELLLSLGSTNIPVSSNPVWNACVRNQELSFDLIQSNVDRFVHRQGSHRKELPWTCRDYHRGRLDDWIYRTNGYDLHILLSRKGEFLGIQDELPDGISLTITRPSHLAVGTP